jgi:hypothetical protein
LRIIPDIIPITRLLIEKAGETFNLDNIQRAFLMKKKIAIILLLTCLISSVTYGQDYWNTRTQLLPWRFPIPAGQQVKHVDLDNDGDPDLIYTFINSIPVVWIDDDDDMKWTDFEGDTDNDCVLIDLNRDGIFAGPGDLSVDWADEDGDGIADIQIVASNGGLNNRYFFDWEADFMIFIDLEKDNIKHFIDWNDIKMYAWDRTGHSNFYADYHGNTLFLKMHASTFRINDMRYSWENPFLFFDPDKDGLSEWTIRMQDTPYFRQKDGNNEKFSDVSSDIDVIFSESITSVAMAWDLDNDNGQGNEFDFDMTIQFSGPGFNYSDQVHRYKSLRGLKEANALMYDSRWRKLDELIYPDHKTAWDLIFKKGNWTTCRFSFDEDDDCNRWERVELYNSRGDLFKIGKNKGGLDSNPQADAAGDRGEFDQDNSGKGNLYIGAFDGRIHLYGAEWGAWRIDQGASSFQGFGGLYDPHGSDRIQKEPERFATVKYTDSDNNGFFDLLEYDLDGDGVFEEKISLIELGINDVTTVVNTSEMGYNDFRKLFRQVAEKQFSSAGEAIKLAKSLDVNPDWYAFWMSPRTLHEKYDYGFWLNFYLYRDMRQAASSMNNNELVRKLDKAYYSGNWKLAGTLK